MNYQAAIAKNLTPQTPQVSDSSLAQTMQWLYANNAARAAFSHCSIFAGWCNSELLKIGFHRLPIAISCCDWDGWQSVPFIILLAPRVDLARCIAVHNRLAFFKEDL